VIPVQPVLRVPPALMAPLAPRVPSDLPE
jgi:hypothetical protein